MQLLLFGPIDDFMAESGKVLLVAGKFLRIRQHAFELAHQKRSEGSSLMFLAARRRSVDDAWV